jgi:hypothetical protein
MNECERNDFLHGMQRSIMCGYSKIVVIVDKYSYTIEIFIFELSSNFC